MVVCSRDRGPAGARCAWCGATGMLEMDHVIAWSHGGRSTIDNAQLLCGRGVGCEGNWAKGAEREDLARVAYKARSGRDPVTGLGVPSRVRTMFERTYGVPSTTGYHTMPAPLQRGVSRTGARTATRNTAKGAR